MPEEEKTKYRIEYDYDGCIGAFACIGACPDNWEMEENGVKARILKKNINEEELEPNLRAAEVCPVGVIKIFNNETGEQLV